VINCCTRLCDCLLTSFDEQSKNFQEYDIRYYVAYATYCRYAKAIGTTQDPDHPYRDIDDPTLYKKTNKALHVDR
jgi:hypothetical protein